MMHLATVGSMSCAGSGAAAIADRMIAAVAPLNSRTTQRRSLPRAEAMRTGAPMMRHEFDLVLAAMLILGICALLSLSTILVRSAGTTDGGGRAIADTTLADLRGTVP